MSMDIPALAIASNKRQASLIPLLQRAASSWNARWLSQTARFCRKPTFLGRARKDVISQRGSMRNQILKTLLQTSTGLRRTQCQRRWTCRNQTKASAERSNADTEKAAQATSSNQRRDHDRNLRMWWWTRPRCHGQRAQVDGTPPAGEDGQGRSQPGRGMNMTESFLKRASNTTEKAKAALEKGATGSCHGGGVICRTRARRARNPGIIGDAESTACSNKLNAAHTAGMLGLRRKQ